MDPKTKRPGPIVFLLAGVVQLVVLATIMLVFVLPFWECPWCSLEIKHTGGRHRPCQIEGVPGGCGGSGRTTLYRRWR